MLGFVRAALLGAASFVLSAAGELSTTNAHDESLAAAPASQPVQLASYTPPAQLLLDTTIDDGEDAPVAADDAAPASAGSLRELVGSITALPEIELTKDLRCLATAVYYEAKGEPLEGQLAVAQVIVNRARSNRYADDFCGVVYEPGQFSFAWDRRPDRPRDSATWRTVQAVAVVAATGNWREVVPDAMAFHATHVAPGWRSMRRVSTIGNHVFYAAR